MLAGNERTAAGAEDGHGRAPRSGRHRTMRPAAIGPPRRDRRRRRPSGTSDEQTRVRTACVTKCSGWEGSPGWWCWRLDIRRRPSDCWGLPVRARRLTGQEEQKLQQIVRRGTSSVRYWHAMMLLASAGGNRVPVIAKPVQAAEDTVRDVIHRFNEIGLACLDPRWAGGRPRQLSTDNEDFVVQTATTRLTKLGQPFTHWSIRKLAAYLRKVHDRVIRIGREALRRLLARRRITFQRTNTWKESRRPCWPTGWRRLERPPRPVRRAATPDRSSAPRTRPQPVATRRHRHHPRRPVPVQALAADAAPTSPTPARIRSAAHRRSTGPAPGRARSTPRSPHPLCRGP